MALLRGYDPRAPDTSGHVLTELRTGNREEPDASRVPGHWVCCVHPVQGAAYGGNLRSGVQVTVGPPALQDTPASTALVPRGIAGRTRRTSRKALVLWG